MRQRDRSRFMTEPVAPRQTICESDRERVFDVPFSDLFRSEVKCPDGTIQVFDGVRAYVDSIKLSEDGKITMQVRAKSSRIGDVTVPYPYHYMLYGECGDVLCMMKINPMRTKSDIDFKTFGMTYNLMCLPWKVCVIANKYKGDSVSMVVVTSRSEWERGELNAYNREVQIFLPVANERQMPMELAQAVMEEGIAKWLGDCQKEMLRKRV